MSEAPTEQETKPRTPESDASRRLREEFIAKMRTMPRLKHRPSAEDAYDPGKSDVLQWLVANIEPLALAQKAFQGMGAKGSREVLFDPSDRTWRFKTEEDRKVAAIASEQEKDARKKAKAARKYERRKLRLARQREQKLLEGETRVKLRPGRLPALTVDALDAMVAEVSSELKRARLDPKPRWPKMSELCALAVKGLPAEEIPAMSAPAFYRGLGRLVESGRVRLAERTAAGQEVIPVRMEKVGLAALWDDYVPPAVAPAASKKPIALPAAGEDDL